MKLVLSGTAQVKSPGIRDYNMLSASYFFNHKNKQTQIA